MISQQHLISQLQDLIRSFKTIQSKEYENSLIELSYEDVKQQNDKQLAKLQEFQMALYNSILTSWCQLGQNIEDHLDQKKEKSGKQHLDILQVSSLHELNRISILLEKLPVPHNTDQAQLVQYTSLKKKIDGNIKLIEEEIRDLEETYNEIKTEKLKELFREKIDKTYKNYVNFTEDFYRRINYVENVPVPSNQQQQQQQQQGVIVIGENESQQLLEEQQNSEFYQKLNQQKNQILETIKQLENLNQSPEVFNQEEIAAVISDILETRCEEDAEILMQETERCIELFKKLNNFPFLVQKLQNEKFNKKFIIHLLRNFSNLDQLEQKTHEAEAKGKLSTTKKGELNYSDYEKTPAKKISVQKVN